MCYEGVCACLCGGVCLSVGVSVYVGCVCDCSV